MCADWILGVVVNVFEAVDVITLIKDSNYDNLALNVGDALQERADVRVLLVSSFHYHLFPFPPLR